MMFRGAIFFDVDLDEIGLGWMTKAQGQAITNNVIACCNHWLKSLCNTKTGMTKRSVARTIIEGV